MTQHSRDTPQFYLTAPSPCPYLPGRHERKVFTHLVGDKAGDLNDLLTHGGFRRSQSIAYRPACDQCRACVSVRVIANEFRPTRGFRKVLARNADIVGEPHIIDGALVVADVAGHFRALEPSSGGRLGPGLIMKANVAATAAPLPFGPGRAFAPLTDGTIVLVPLEKLRK